MDYVNMAAIIILCAVIIIQRMEFVTRIERMHERLQDILDREAKHQVAAARYETELAELRTGFGRLRETTYSALNIFEQQVLRGAREDLEVLQEIDDGTAEEAEEAAGV